MLLNLAGRCLLIVY